MSIDEYVLAIPPITLIDTEIAIITSSYLLILLNKKKLLYMSLNKIGTRAVTVKFQH